VPASVAVTPNGATAYVTDVNSAAVSVMIAAGVCAMGLSLFLR
jgi:hypothetical protein